MRPVEISNRAPSFSVNKVALVSLVHILDKRFRAPSGTLSIVFVSHSTLAKMHGDYCGDPSPTDIITFPIDDEEIWGELYISPQAAVEFIIKSGGNFEEEVKRYVIHGYLHLMGYDDLTPKGRAQMRRLEREGLKVSAKIKKIFKLKISPRKSLPKN